MTTQLWTVSFLIGVPLPSPLTAKAKTSLCLMHLPLMILIALYLLAFGDSDAETLGFVFDLPTSFPSELGDEAIGTYSVDELSYGAISGLVGSIELNISSYENDVMSGTFSMTGIKTSEDAAGRDSVIVTNGIFDKHTNIRLIIDRATEAT